MATDRKLGIIEVESELLTNIDNFLKNDENITRVECPFPHVTSAVSAFQYCVNLKSFKGDLNSLTNGTRMFSDCEKLETFTGNLPSLTKGNSMFYATNLSEFTTELPSLTDGTEMFQECKNLKTFNSNLQSLTNYMYIFRNTKLNTFKAVEININDSGEDFMKNSYLSTSKDTLTEFNCNLQNMTNTDNMFKNYTSLQYVTSYMPNVTSSQYMFAYCYAYDVTTNTTTGLQSFVCNLIGSNNCSSMFRGCKNLSYINAKTKNLQIGKHMFRDCPKLNENNFHLDSDDNYSTYFYGTLVNAIAMFQGTSFTKVPKSWNFKSLEIANQMFQHTQIGANGETVFIDMPNQFPKVKVYKDGETYKYGEKPGPTPVAYMFGSCPIKSVNFDVSSVDNGTSMFHNCTQLTQCTGAKFQEGGAYQSMFTESKFTQGNAQYILYYAKLANVASLHIGIDFQLSEEHDFVKGNYLIIHPDDNSGRQWMYKYCDSHKIGDCTCSDYKYIVFVCNPN